VTHTRHDPHTEGHQMAGNSSRRGAVKRTGKGNPTAGSGGRVRRGLEGRGPTPKAVDREGHVAQKKRRRAERTAPRRSTRPRPGGDAEWVAGRNAVVEALRAGIPVTAVYVAEGAERDGRLREVFRWPPTVVSRCWRWPGSSWTG